MTPERWLFDGERLSILRPRSGSYQAVDTSEAFAGASALAMQQLLAQGKSLGRTGFAWSGAGAASATPSPQPRSRERAPAFVAVPVSACVAQLLPGLAPWTRQEAGQN
jgi:hypothetical protein